MKLACIRSRPLFPIPCLFSNNSLYFIQSLVLHTISTFSSASGYFSLYLKSMLLSFTLNCVVENSCTVGLWDINTCRVKHGYSNWTCHDPWGLVQAKHLKFKILKMKSWSGSVTSIDIWRIYIIYTFFIYVLGTVPSHGYPHVTWQTGCNHGNDCFTGKHTHLKWTFRLKSGLESMSSSGYYSKAWLSLDKKCGVCWHHSGIYPWF